MKFVLLLVSILFSTFSKSDFSETKLKNGIKVLIIKKKSPVSAVAVIVGSGSYSDPYKKSGLAHYTEHAMFKGLKDKKHGAEFSKFTKMTGANFNAYTGYNVTAFYTIVPSEYLNDLLKIESQRFNKFSIEKDSALTERNVVLEELNMYNNYDSHLLFQDSMSALYTNNNYRHSISGYKEEIQTFTVKDVKDFRKYNYVANNMKIIVMSDLHPKLIIRKLEYYFGKIHKNPHLKKSKDNTYDVDYPRSSYFVKKISPQTGLHEIAMFWKMPSYNTHKKEMIAMSICASILRNKASKFAKTLIKDKKIASNIGTLNNTSYFASEGCPHNLFIIEASGYANIKGDELLKNIQYELKEIIKTGFSKEDLQTFKEQFEISNYYREDNASNVFQFFINLGVNFSYKDFLEHSKTIKEIDIDFLNSTFKKYLSRDPNVISNMSPVENIETENNTEKTE